MSPPPKRELAATLEGRSATPFHSALARELQICSHVPQEEVLAGGMDSPGEAPLQHTDCGHRPSLSGVQVVVCSESSQAGLVGPENSDTA